MVNTPENSEYVLSKVLSRRLQDGGSVPPKPFSGDDLFRRFRFRVDVRTLLQIAGADVVAIHRRNRRPLFGPPFGLSRMK